MTEDPFLGKVCAICGEQAVNAQMDKTGKLFYGCTRPIHHEEIYNAFIKL